VRSGVDVIAERVEIVEKRYCVLKCEGKFPDLGLSAIEVLGSLHDEMGEERDGMSFVGIHSSGTGIAGHHHTIN
jgi:hypothetical protein